MRFLTDSSSTLALLLSCKLASCVNISYSGCVTAPQESTTPVLSVCVYRRIAGYSVYTICAYAIQSISMYSALPIFIILNMGIVLEQMRK